MFSAFNPSRGMDAVDTAKSIKETSDAFNQGSKFDKGFATAKLSATFLSFLPGNFGLLGNVASMNLNAADSMRNPSAKGFVTLGFDVAKIATTFHPPANLAVRGVEVVKDSFEFCMQHPKEFSDFLKLSPHHPDRGGFNA